MNGKSLETATENHQLPAITYRNIHVDDTCIFQSTIGSLFYRQPTNPPTHQHTDPSTHWSIDLPQLPFPGKSPRGPPTITHTDDFPLLSLMIIINHCRHNGTLTTFSIFNTGTEGIAVSLYELGLDSNSEFFSNATEATCRYEG